MHILRDYLNSRPINNNKEVVERYYELLKDISEYDKPNVLTAVFEYPGNLNGVNTDVGRIPAETARLMVGAETYKQIIARQISAFYSFSSTYNLTITGYPYSDTIQVGKGNQVYYVTEEDIKHVFTLKLIDYLEQVRLSNL